MPRQAGAITNIDRQGIHDMDGLNTSSLPDHSLNVALIGNYVPRHCGIATFTADVATWVKATLGPRSDVFVVAMNDRPEGYEYPPMVRFEVLANNPRDYPRAADYLNLSEIDLVCLQHEFGIFGGARGSYITDLLRDLRKPVVTTAHTVLPDPEPDRRKALADVCALSDAVIVMSDKSIDFLERYYGVPREKVHLIHHGVPDMPFADSEGYKTRWGLQGKTVLLTFGLLHPRKGIEYMIKAMPPVVERFPDAVYVVLGATHPPVKKREGEKYRFSLKQLARDLGVEDNVIFYDRFVSLEELTSFLASCDIYVTPYLDMNQIVSGTLAYAMGLGKPAISTPYFYATELLAGGRGIIVPVKDPDAFARETIGLLSDPARMEDMRTKAYAFGHEMRWEEVSRQYVDLFERVLAGRRTAPPQAAAPRKAVLLRDLPRPRLDHLARLTDHTGLIAEAHFDIADRASGYRTEDNALALAAAVQSHVVQTDDEMSLGLARTYIGLLRYMQRLDGRFHNLLNYDKTFADEMGGQECQGKALAGLGLTVALEEEEALVSFAKLMFDDALQYLDLSYPRAMAYAACGCYHYLTRFPGASLAEAALERLADGLISTYEDTATDGWEWFEDELTYANGLLPRALFLAFRAVRNARYREVAVESLGFLTRTCYIDGFFDLVGDQGWYARGGDRAKFNQLPIEAASLTEAYVDAFMVTHEDSYLELARAAFEWFLGRNALSQPLYDFALFACSDGLMVHGVSPNMGAEATVHWLLSLLRVQTALHLGPLESEEDLLASR
ncbi:MAG: glycosyltransferase family 4 protein [Candidatus Geothermincolia bacterium]